MSWQQSLRTLRQQFDARAAASRGLHHLMVEVGDDERDRMAGPDWFRRESRVERMDQGFRRSERWAFVAGGSLPWVHPSFREVRPGEEIEGVEENRVVRDGSGRPRAVFEPMRLRSSCLCGDAVAVNAFQSLATAASRVLSGHHDWRQHPLGIELDDLFRPPRGGVRYVFGNVTDRPKQFIANSWQPGMLVFSDGVLIDLPLAESEPGADHWLLLLHRLSWRRLPASPLRGERMGWHDNTSVPYEWVLRSESAPDLPGEWLERFARMSKTSYYSILGDEQAPLDVNLASVFAIDALLTTTDSFESRTERVETAGHVTQPTVEKVMPLFTTGEYTAVKKRHNPRTVLLTATRVELEAVLRRLTPLPGEAGVVRFSPDNNTYHAGLFGGRSVVVCMCAMGTTGRDSSQAVAAEVIQFWEPTDLIMVGICFGSRPDRQRLGDVLISERIIAYEPQRVGADGAVPRGQHFLAGVRLLNRFSNYAVDWDFRYGAGDRIRYSVGPLMSGEKLVDSSAFKKELLDAHPTALGGEMEGAGVAAAADRRRCEWILVKGICDWADGKKSDDAQPLAAAAAVSLVEHVLAQADAI